MGPIVLLIGVLVALYGVAAMFAGGGVASATRGAEHSRRYSLVSLVIGCALVAMGLGMIAT